MITEDVKKAYTIALSVIVLGLIFGPGFAAGLVVVAGVILLIHITLVSFPVPNRRCPPTETRVEPENQ